MLEQDLTWQGPSMQSSATSLDPRYGGHSGDPGLKQAASTWLVAAYIATGVAVFLFTDRANFLADLDSYGRHANGVVTGVFETRHRRGRKSYHLEFHYYEAGGGLHTGRKSVPHEEARRARPGDFVDVFYDPASPARYIPKSVADAREDLKTGGYFMGAMLVAMWGWGFWKLSCCRGSA